VAFVAISMHSFSALRHAFYETFLHVHILLVLVSFVGLWMHLLDYKTPRRFLLAAIVLWATEVSSSALASHALLHFTN
jgi:hypothetical protein